jgi:hypothetical protein
MDDWEAVCRELVSLQVSMRGGEDCDRAALVERVRRCRMRLQESVRGIDV